MEDLLVKTLVWAPAVAVALMACLCLVLPSVFWDGFVFRYYWGPIVADAGGDAGDLTPDYNWIDTISYGGVLAWASFLIYRRLSSRGLRVGPAFFAAMSPIIILGPAARVLEDMELFNEPLQYLFISPVIYIFLGISTLLTIEAAAEIERLKGMPGVLSASLLIALPGLILSLAIMAFPDQFNADIPVVAVLAIAAITAVAYAFVLRRRTYESLVGWTWTTVLLFVCVAFVLWFAGGSFRHHYISMSGGNEVDTNLPGAFIILGATVLSASIVAGSIYLIPILKRKMRHSLHLVNAMILSGHMLDASATWVGIDFYGYSEKHRLPSLLIDATGTASVMYPLKLSFLLPALYFIDSSIGEGGRNDPHLLALVRLAVLVLGSGPGTRDLLRLALGV